MGECDDCYRRRDRSPTRRRLPETWGAGWVGTLDLIRVKKWNTTYKESNVKLEIVSNGSCTMTFNRTKTNLKTLCGIIPKGRETVTTERVFEFKLDDFKIIQGKGFEVTGKDDRRPNQKTKYRCLSLEATKVIDFVNT